MKSSSSVPSSLTSTPLRNAKRYCCGDPWTKPPLAAAHVACCSLPTCIAAATNHLSHSAAHVPHCVVYASPSTGQGGPPFPSRRPWSAVSGKPWYILSLLSRLKQYRQAFKRMDGLITLGYVKSRQRRGLPVYQLTPLGTYTRS